MAKETFVRYGKHRVPLVVPDDVAVLQARQVPPLSRPEAAVEEALSNPIGCPSLSSLLRQREPRNAVVTISDITRPVPNRFILPPILRALKEYGLGAEDVTILIATGMHRPSTGEEKLELLGDEIASAYSVVDHRSENRDELTKLPRLTVKGTSAWLNSLYLSRDFKIVTGFIEPHFMAGFSGGRKGVCPGLVNVETVQKFHGFKFLDSENATNFQLEGNPLHEEAMDVVEMAGIDFLVNVGLNEEKQIAGVFAGDWKEAFLAGTRSVKEWTSAPAGRVFDVVVTCAGGYPLDKTLYQTGKGMCSALPILKQGGIAVVASACSEGLGSPSFSKIMREWGSDWQGFLKYIESSKETMHDQWGLQMHSKLLRRVGSAERLLFASRGISAVDQSKMSLTAIADEDEPDEPEAVRRGIQSTIDRLPDGTAIAVIPDGPYAVPVLSNDARAGTVS